MSTSQFMRGDPLDYTQTFYLAYTNSSNTYVYCYNSSGYSTSSTTPTAGFLLVTNDYSDYDPVLFTVQSLGNNTYSFLADGFYLGVNSSNVIDLISDTSVAIKLSGPSSTNINIYSIQNILYPSVVYIPTIDNVSYRWYIFNPTSTSNWSTYTISLGTVSPFIFPSNSGQLAVWQNNSTYPDGACFYSTTDNGIALEWLYNWSQGTSVNCDTVGTLDSTYNNCYFSSLVACESLYTYNLCTGSDTCGNCQGMLSASTSTLDACYYNVPGSSPPLFLSTEPSILTTDNSIELPDTTTDDGSGCGTSSIIILFFFLLLIIMFVGYFLYKSGSSKKNPDIQQAQPYYGAIQMGLPPPQNRNKPMYPMAPPPPPQQNNNGYR